MIPNCASPSSLFKAHFNNILPSTTTKCSNRFYLSARPSPKTPVCNTLLSPACHKRGQFDDTKASNNLRVPVFQYSVPALKKNYGFIARIVRHGPKTYTLLSKLSTLVTKRMQIFNKINKMYIIGSTSVKITRASRSWR
jgi:hypothetical protein